LTSSEPGSKRRRVPVTNTPTDHAVSADDLDHLIWRLGRTDPQLAATILREKPLWLVIGAFVLGSFLMLSGVAYATIDGNPSGLIAALFGLLVLSRAFRSSPGNPLSSLFDSYAEQIRSRVGEEVQSEEKATPQKDEPTRQTVVSSASEALQKQEAILREIYTQGLTQARLTFGISVLFMILGAGVLLLGVALAIFTAPTTGEKYSSIVAGTAGVVINLTSSIFIVQSNRARRSMGEQGVMLREESQEDRRLNAARELAASISDAAMRDKVQAELSILLLRRGEGRAGESPNAPVSTTNKDETTDS
jgi:hypothetical protein